MLLIVLFSSFSDSLTIATSKSDAGLKPMTITKAIGLIILSLSSLAASEDDFHFEQFKNQNLQRLWGIPDTTIEIGHLFHFEIPKNAFYGNVARFKAYCEDGSPLPKWLIFQDKIGVMEGVPLIKDVGEHYIMVKAFNKDFRGFAKDIFALEVLSKVDFRHKTTNECEPTSEKIFFSIILDTDFEKLSPSKRVNLIRSLSQNFKIPSNVIYLRVLKGNDQLLNHDIINAGPGDAKKKKHNLSLSLNFEVDCNNKKWNYKEISISCLNGSLSTTLSEPVLGWKLWKEKKPYYRSKREVKKQAQIDGNEDLEIGIPERRVVVENVATPKFTPDPTATAQIEATSRHHRHNHGIYLHSHQALTINAGSTLNIMPTPTFNPSRPSSILPEDFERSTEMNYDYDITSSSGTSFEHARKNDKEANNSSITIDSTPPLPNLNSIGEEYTTLKPKNSPPTIAHRLQKIVVTAGKVLRYKIPSNTFLDNEDGDTRNLNLVLKVNGSDIPPDYWIQFNELTQEIYALPLDDRISKWSFDLIAYDSEDLFVLDNIEVRVQDHKGRRAVNFAITIELSSVTPGVSLDWELELLDAIRKQFMDLDTSNITVLNISTTRPYSFTWTNDTLPRNECPLNDINYLFKVLTDEDGLNNKEIFPGLKISNVTTNGKGLCESKPPDDHSRKNYSPVLRNPVDSINATVGQLLFYSVPADSFYDPEDGSARNLKLSLETNNGKPIPYNNWLQFDIKNQEFYGIPMTSDVGQKEYLLICKDKGGLVARDVLAVIVQPAPRIMYNVEFSMKLALNYKQFTENISLQRLFVEKLALLFGDTDTNAIVLSGFSPGSTIVTWHNRTLPTDVCPHSTIKQLRQMILGDDERLTSNVTRLMGEEFPVLSARLTPTGLCQGALIEVSVGGAEIHNTDDVTAVSHNEHFIISLIVPAVVITVMLLCAGIIACILYRRKRTGKMSVGDEDERQAFRSKGIPVIFQDELDERPEPTNKSPIIMKEEKPPLPPPEYQRGPPLATTALLSDTEDSPYQPPPPFTASRDSARPKPTPTYRMPPPYVPP